MVQQYYQRVKATNTQDGQILISSLTSTPQEPKHICAVGVLKETNAGILHMLYERDDFAQIDTGQASLTGVIEYEVDIPLKDGETFALKLENLVNGTNAGVVAYIRYEIK